jgi:hypothetical protein
MVTRVTGRPSNGSGEKTTYVAPNQLARLRTFCLFSAVLYLCVAVLIAFLRPLLANLVDEGHVQVAAPLLAQEQLCATSLVVLAALLLWACRAIGRDPAARVGRIARVLALVTAAICAVGLAVVMLLPIAESTLPTVLVTGVVIFFALYVYAAMATLRSP